MSNDELKKIVHNLIDETDNENLLYLISGLLKNKEEEKNLELSEKEKELIEKAFKESETEESLLNNETVFTQIRNEL